MRVGNRRSLEGSRLPALILLILLACVVVAGPARADDLDVTANMALPAGNYTYENVWVRSGATLTLQGDPAGGTGVTISATNFTVESGGIVSADGEGYAEKTGPGTATSGASGAGHGGRGGQGYQGLPGEPYGSALRPVTLGSGGNSGAGGGAIQLQISGTLTVAGMISANGEFGGAAGGSIYITTGAFSGNGTIRANGGRGECGACTSHIAGGGGGRVAIYHTSSSYTGTVEAAGGLGNHNEPVTEHQHGTVGLFDVSNPSQVHLYTGHSWRFQANDADDGKNALTLHDITAVDSELTVEDGIDIAVTGAFSLTRSADPAVSTLALFDDSGTLRVAAGTLTVGEGCTVTVDAKGYASQTGPGATPDSQCGAGHGGMGGQGANGTPGVPYGSAMSPDTLGSGGNSGAGGGAIAFDTGGALTVDGTISANGEFGGGAGGSIWISAGSLAGAGTFRANGGRGECGSCTATIAGGGGGRIAVFFASSTFVGLAEARGGLTNHNDPVTAHQDGTVGFVDVSNPAGGHLFTGHSWRFLAIDALATASLHDVTSIDSEIEVEVGANPVIIGGTWTLASTTEDAPCSITPYEEMGALHIEAENFGLGEGCTIDGSGKGYRSGAGPGTGDELAGASYGGLGGNGSYGAIPGPTYGAVTAPTDFGSGSEGNGGGVGGGAIRLAVADELVLDGTVRVNGHGVSEGYGSGAGAGGSVYVTAGSITGAGSVTANGGRGGCPGCSRVAGGGGGGRIAFRFAELGFTGTAVAAGGLSNKGTVSGEDGSVVWMREIPIAVGGASELAYEPFVHYTYRLDWPDSMPDVVLVRLTPLDASGEWTLLGKYGAPPANGSADWTGAGPSSGAPPAYEMLVPLAAPGPYFFDVFNEVFLKAIPRFRLEVIDVDRYAANVSLGSGSNSGATTLRIAAAGIDDSVEIQLRTSGGATLRTFTPQAWDATSLTVQFNLAGLAPQVVDVVVRWGEDYEEVLQGAFQITGPNPGTIALSMDAPRVVRALRGYTLWVNIANTGGTDAPAPLVQVTSLQDLAMQPSPGKPFRRGPVTLLATRETAPVTTLPPGTVVRVPVGVVPEGVAHDMCRFRAAVLAEDSTPIPWTNMKLHVRPEQIGLDAWNVIWPQFTSEMGATWDVFGERLRSDAEYLAGLGSLERDVSRLMDLAFQTAAANMGAQIVAVDAATVVPQMPIVFERQFANSIDARFRLGPFGRGWTHSYHYSLAFPDEDTAVLSVPGGGVRTFRKSPRGEWQSSARDFGAFEEISGGYRVTDRGPVVRTFNDAGELVSVTDGNGAGVTLTYDGGRLTTIAHSNGDTFTLEYNGSGRIVRLRDHADRAVTYAYTGELLTSVDPPSTGATTYAYVTAAGAAQYALQSIARPDGTHRTFTYDAGGRLASRSRDGGAEAFTYAYPSPGAVEITNGSGAAAAFSCDGSRLVLRAEDPLGNATRFYCNGAGLLETLVTRDAAVFDFGYDEGGNRTRIVDPAGNETMLVYAPARGLLDELRDANGSTTYCSYDAAGNLLQTLFADGSSQTITRNASGLAEQATNRRGDAIAFAYDERGAVTGRDVAGGRSIAFERDAAGRAARCTEDATDIVLGYDDRDRITSVAYPNGVTLAFQYDAAGKRTRIASNDGLDIRYGYDNAGRLSTLRDAVNALIVQYAYDEAGRVTTETRGNGTYTACAYDLRGRVTDIVHYGPGAVVQEQLSYAYDSMGRCISQTDGSGETTYAYDPAGRLQRVDFPDGTFEDYSYDAVGNRQRVTRNAGTENYSTNALNQYVCVGGVAHSYDADGNLTSDGARTYAFDAENKLVEASNGVDTWSYGYDGLDNRAAVTRGGDIVHLVNDPAGLVNVAAEYDENGDLIAYHVFGRRLVARIDAEGDALYYGFDNIGNTRLVTDDSGAVVNSYAYSPFGVVRQAVEGNANPFAFRGAEGVVTDESGLVYMRTRYYAPALGRFITPDSIGIGGGVNLYAYADNDPVNFSDPEGMRSEGDNTLMNEFIIFQNEETFYAPNPNPDTPPPDNPTSPPNYPPPPPPSPNGPPSPFVNNTPIQIRADDPILDELEPETLFWLNIEIVAPGDPNEKTATPGAGPNHLVEVDEPIQYTVYFENVPAASAPAQEVFITDQLDPNLDPSTLVLTEVVWGDEAIDMPAGAAALKTRQTVHDHRADVDASWWVDVEVTLGAGGLLQWVFRTLDPATGDLPDDVLAGFLPPNDNTGRGEGHVTFKVVPRPDTPNGTVIRNRATIVFDVEQSIDTNEVSNLIGELVAGDVDVSGQATAVDLQIVINAALGLPVEEDCDVNGDLDVNAVDVQLVINALLGLWNGE